MVTFENNDPQKMLTHKDFWPPQNLDTLKKLYPQKLDHLKVLNPTKHLPQCWPPKHIYILTKMDHYKFLPLKYWTHKKWTPEDLEFQSLLLKLCWAQQTLPQVIFSLWVIASYHDINESLPIFGQPPIQPRVDSSCFFADHAVSVLD